MESGRVHARLGHFSLANLRASAEARHHDRLGGFLRLGHGVADVLGQLANLVGERRAGGDAQVRDDLRSERLGQLDLAPEPPFGRRVRASAASSRLSGRMPRTTGFPT